MTDITDITRLASEIEDAAGSLESARDEGDQDQAAEALDDLRAACEELSTAALNFLDEAENG
jgi:hypothetical protein